MRLGVFVPEEHPALSTLEPGVSEHDAKGRANPHHVKLCKFFGQTKVFLRERYAKYRILEGPGVTFDCLVQKFQPRIFNKTYRDEYGNPVFCEVNDRYEWYERAIRMSIFGWQVGFVCRSNLCERDWCILHRRNPRKIVPVDIYSLISTVEGVSVGVAKSHVAKAFGMKLGELESKGARPSTKLRRKIPKTKPLGVLNRFKNFRTQHVSALISELGGIVRGGELVEWRRRLFNDEYAYMKDRVVDNLYVIKGPAVKAYVWLLIGQEELARNTKGPCLEVSDKDLATGIGVTKTTAQDYRALSTQLKLIEVSLKKDSKTKEMVITKAKY